MPLSKTTLELERFLSGFWMTATTKLPNKPSQSTQPSLQQGQCNGGDRKQPHHPGVGITPRRACLRMSQPTEGQDAAGRSSGCAWGHS